MSSAAPLDDLLDFLRFASISTEPAYREPTARCADWVAAKFRAMNLETAVHATPGHPVVVARTSRDPHKRTVLIYGHYDVQPVDPIELWTNPPFEPTIASGFVTARGATDNKGQILAHMRGVEDLLSENAGGLPVNVVFLVEGEEEIGSTHLPQFLADHSTDLACDIVVVSDTGMVGPGQPTFTYGLRGLAALEVELTGPAMDLHSGMFGGAVLNPIAALARLAAGCHDDDGRIVVNDFFNNVQPLQDWEREAWRNLPLNEQRLLEMTGAPALRPEPGYTPFESIAARPTIEFNGVLGGYTGEGTKTVLPSKASTKITCRLVPNQDPAQVAAALQRHFEKHAPPAVSLTIRHGHGAKPYATDPHSGFGVAAQQALEQTWGRPAALVREGGSIPIVQTFRDVLGVDTLLLGLALPDCRAHSPNETFPLENLEKGIALNKALLREIASA